ncbi:MAG: hypothetical protein GIX03_11965 [Candidatus Eremiobacteraeota bacterium]|nr:hypothetical protein [Candidatus Eremiobacteraeota bacterium]MBC5803681.1 hypothetical protein [Candidatus Eremiobacteraeota bacterium]MBC5821484.1 hypothetical protein [Candidatus Eremiobacteraeota bacterium]
MIVNLYVDHMMSTPPASAEEVWNETREHAKLFSDAATRIGLTPAEYREFRLALLDGRVRYVTLPRRLDAMSGNRHGSVYAVKNAYMTSTIQGWRVALADGNVVYVPKVCGNISLLRHAAIAQHVVRPPKRVAYVQRHKPRFVPAIGSANETPVTPVAVAPPAAVAAAPVAAAAVPAAATAAHGVSPFLFIIPAVIGGIIGSQPHHTTPPPPCNHGSNSMGVCTK